LKQPSILKLRPTQFVLGTKEVEAKYEKLKAFNRPALIKYCTEHIIPVVIGPNKNLYMIDHHHFARACWELNIEHYQVKMIKDLSSKSEKEFWNIMVQKDWVYLNDQFGMGPHSPFALPCDIRGLADDPFRSLAWELINIGSIKKMNIPFFEFKWAAFFRMNLDIPLHSKSNFKAAIKLSKKLSKSKAAEHLPGFKS
jgi:hypothetical protein